jgi:hypothetical protein
MGRRARIESLDAEMVTSDPLERAATPEAPQRVRGSWDIWPVLRDPQTPAAIARGDLDEVLDELRDVARAHDASEVVRAVDARRGA